MEGISPFHLVGAPHQSLSPTAALRRGMHRGLKESAAPYFWKPEG